jgi:DNA modification methylase
MNEFLNQIHQGDCIEVMSRMPAASVDLIVTSPPYNLRNSTGGGMRMGAAASGRMPHCSTVMPGTFRTTRPTQSTSPGSVNA